MLKIILKRYMPFYSLKRDRDKAKKIFYGRVVFYIVLGHSFRWT